MEVWLGELKKVRRASVRQWDSERGRFDVPIHHPPQARKEVWAIQCFRIVDQISSTVVIPGGDSWRDTRACFKIIQFRRSGIEEKWVIMTSGRGRRREGSCWSIGHGCTPTHCSGFPEYTLNRVGFERIARVWSRGRGHCRVYGYHSEDYCLLHAHAVTQHHRLNSTPNTPTIRLPSNCVSRSSSWYRAANISKKSVAISTSSSRMITRWMVGGVDSVGRPLSNVYNHQRLRKRWGQRRVWAKEHIMEGSEDVRFWKRP